MKKIEPLNVFDIAQDAQRRASDLPDYPFMGEDDRAFLILSYGMTQLAQKINEVIAHIEAQGSKKK